MRSGKGAGVAAATALWVGLALDLSACAPTLPSDAALLLCGTMVGAALTHLIH